METNKTLNQSFWFFISNLSVNFFSSIFWILFSKYINPSIVGEYSVIIAMVNILKIFFLFGIHNGSKRFFGPFFKNNEDQKLQNSFFSVVTLLFCVISIVELFFFTLLILSTDFFSIESVKLPYLMILFFFDTISQLFISFFNSILKAKFIALLQVFMNILKITIGFLVIPNNPNFRNTILSHIIPTIILHFILIIRVLMFFKKRKIKTRFNKIILKEIMKSSMPIYVPNILYILGISMAQLLIYSFEGGYEAGLYHIIFSLATIVYFIPESVKWILIPSISGSEDLDSRIISNIRSIIKFCLIFTNLIGFIMIIYPKIFLIFFGPEYFEVIFVFQILLIGSIFFPFFSIGLAFFYGKGNYKITFLTNIILSLSRIILYFILIQNLSILGLALSYTTGSILAVIIMLFYLHSKKKEILSKDYIWIVIIVFMISIIMKFLNIIWWLGIPLIIFLCFFCFLKFNIISKLELYDFLSAFIPDKYLKKIKICN